jgi:hypothetical protein
VTRILAKRTSRLTPFLLLLLLVGGCSSGSPPPREPRRTPPPPAPEGEGEKVRPGSKRALIATLRNVLPQELEPSSEKDALLILADAQYLQTEDRANSWVVVYTTKDDNAGMNVAAIEYPSESAALEHYESAVAKVSSACAATAKTIPVKGTDRTWTGTMPAGSPAGLHALAFVAAGRYLFGFDRPGAETVGEPAVSKFVETCLATLKPPPAPPSGPSGG